MSAKEDTPKYLKPYENAVETHGGSFEATLWCSKDGQIVRFKTFTDDIDFTGKSIVDVGCGIGDFASFLLESKIKFSTLIGIDAMESMIQSATEREVPNCSFRVGDVVVDEQLIIPADWLVFSGTLNAMTQEEALTLIQRAFNLCTVGVAFNFLSNQSWRDPTSEDLSPASRFDTLEVLGFAFTLTPLVSFTQSYLEGHDATIILRKQEVSQ
jgi:SAM-dependent methyltransferase